jgi:hypothetical protein
MPKYKLNNGEVVDTSNFSEEEENNWLFNNSENIDLNYDFQNGAVETDASATPVNNPASNGDSISEDGLSDGVSSYDDARARRIKENRDYDFYKNNPREKRPRETEEAYQERINKTVTPLLDDFYKKEDLTETEKLMQFLGINEKTPTDTGVNYATRKRAAKNGYKINKAGEQVSLATEEDYKYYGTTDKEIAENIIIDEELEEEFQNMRYNAIEDNSFVDSYYNTAELRELGINISDFQGFLNVVGFSKDFENDITNGRFEEGGNVGIVDDNYKVDDPTLAKELALSDMLNAYMYNQDERSNKRIDLSDIIKGDKTIEALKEPHKITNFDFKKLQAYEENNFSNLKARNDKNKADRLEEKNKRIGVIPTTLAEDNLIYDIFTEGGGGFADAVKDTAYWVADLTGFDTFAKRGRDSMRLQKLGEEVNTLDYLSVEGLGLEVDGKTYIKDAKGNIANITDGFNIYDTMPPDQIEAISKKIDKDGTQMKDWNLRGGVRMTANVIGNIIFQLFGQKGVGVGMKQGGKLLAKGFAASRGYKTIAQSAKAYRGSSFNYFYGSIPNKVAKVLTPERVNAAVFQSLYGASVGYENTIRAAKEAGLSDAEAENLATIAQSDMALLYAVTGPINPRINAMKALDKLVSKSGVIGKLVNDYAKNGVRKEAAKGFKESLANVARGAKSFGIAFGEEGFKEVIQENIQQAGEYLLVNKGTNKEAGFDLMKNTYSMKDIIDTTVLSFAAGGLLGGTTTVKTGFKQNPYKRLESLFYVGQDIEGSKKRYAEMVKSGVATQEQVDAIIFDAEAAVESENKMPPWIIQQTPENFIEIARAQKQLNDLQNKKKNYLDSFASGIDEQIKAKQAEIQALTDAAAKIAVEKEAAIVKKILDKKGTKVENGIDKDNQRVVVFNTTDELRKADKTANLKADAYFDEATGQIVINLERAAKTQAVSAASHELLHKILKAEFSSNPEILKIVEEFKTILKDTRSVYANSKTGKRVYVLEAIEARLASYPAGYVEQNPDEWLTAFSDMVAKGEVDFDSIGESNWVKIGKAIANVLKGKGFTKIEFKTGQDVFDFIRDYQSSIKSGKISRKSSIRLKRGEKTSSTGRKLSKSRKLTEAEEDRMEAIDEEIGEISDELMQGFIDQDTHDKRIAKLEEEYENIENPPKVEAKAKPKPKPKAKTDNVKAKALKKEKVLIGDAINKMIPEDMTSAEWPEVAGKIIVAFQDGMLFPLFKKQIAKMGIVENDIYGKTSKEFYDATIGVQYIKNILNFKPKTKENPQGNDDFGGYIIGSEFGLNNRIKEALTELRKGKELNEASDVSNAKGIAADEGSNEVEEKPKYRSLVEASVVPGEVVDAIEGKLRTVLRTLKSRMDEAISGNRTVAPYIAEIIAEMGTQADIDLKTAMGGKKDLKLRKFLLKTKKAVLQNMTTTWLMGKDGEGGIPQAIQKQLKEDGRWVSYPAWVGKEIAREKTSTDDAGRTSGALLVRRHPNIANYKNVDEIIDNDTYLAQFLDETGNPIRGRKEALAKIMAAEMSLEIFNAKLVDPNSEISEAFKNNQRAKSVTLAENLVQQIANDSERGNVKYSNSFAKKAGTLLRLSQKIGIENVIDEQGNIIIDKRPYTRYPGVGKVVRDAWNEGLFPAPNALRYLDRLKISSKIPNEVKELASRALTAKYSTKEQLDAFAKDMVTVGIALGSDITNKIGFDGLGFINKLLDPAANKIKGPRKGEEGIYFKTLQKLRSEQEASKGLPEELDMSKVSPMHPKSGIIPKIINILKSDKTAAQKKKEYEKLIPEIKEANIHNKILAKHIIKKLVEMRRSGAISPESFVNLFQAQTSAARGFRSLTGLSYITFKDGPQLNIKGEHLADNAGSMLEFAELGFDNLTDAELDAKIDEILEYHEQWLEERTLLNLVDAFGRNNKSKDLRVKLLPKVNQQNVFAWDLRPAKDLLTEKEASIRAKKKADLDRFKIEKANMQNQAISNATDRSYSITPKGISVFDFDDTLARTKSNVLYVTADGKKGKLTAAQFASKSETMAAQGVKFDFSEFSKVVKGELGPLFSEAQKKKGKYTNKDIFVLTARPANSAIAIHEFLKSEGLNIPLNNITGLGNGSPKAKADWMVSKIAEGYNDFYFADDHLGNVKAVGKALKSEGVTGQTELSIVDFKNQPKAVRDILNTFDVKGPTQRSRVKFSNSMNKNMNDMLERASGIPSRKRLTRIEGAELGKKKGRFKIWMPSSLEDFRGLTEYTFAGKGRQGDIDQKFFQDALVTPYWRGINEMDQVKQSLKNGFAALNKQFKPVLKKLGKKMPGMEYTHDQAIRVYLWNKAGYEIPGLTKKLERTLVAAVQADADLLAYANGALRLSQRKQWSKPSDYWNVQTILSDINNFTEKAGRKEYLKEFIDNADLIFSEKNLNKIEAIYGRAHREAIEDILYRMKNGTNRAAGMKKNEQTWNNWLNNSIGAIMFFNRRSALLQTLSIVNFVNWSDNNPMKAAAAFANQAQFWSDFAMIFNSASLKQRRSGLKTDVNAAELASAVTGATDKASAALNYLLKIGFTPTQMVDSFAIASGGATFYRNRLNTYLKEKGADGKPKYTQKEAEKQAFFDFSVVSRETQQSGDPALISSDQSSSLGRVVLNFMNTPIQLNRSIKKAAQNIYYRRREPGMTQMQSDFSNFSKIIYYGTIQNAIFSTLQAAMFALIPGFNDDDEELDDLTKQEKIDKKIFSVINSMVDTTLKGGFGLPGAVVSILKNAIIEYKKQEDRGFLADDSKTLIALLNISPAVGSKARKIVNSIKTERFDKEVINERGWDVTIDGKFNLSPRWSSAGNLIEGAVNIPVARVVDELNSITEALDSRNTAYQRIALALGWKTWNVGAKNEENDLIEVVAKYRNKLKKKAETKAKKAAEKLKERRANIQY